MAILEANMKSMLESINSLANKIEVMSNNQSHLEIEMDQLQAKQLEKEDPMDTRSHRASPTPVRPTIIDNDYPHEENTPFVPQSTSPRPTEFKVGINIITGKPFHDNPPPLGAVDVKGAKMPEPFNGTKEDARPFLMRMMAFFTLRPNAYRLSMVRQLTACQLITTKPASSWATQIVDNWSTGKAGMFYTDTWDNFALQFNNAFGIQNEKEDAINKLQTIRQGDSLEEYITEFIRYQTLSGLPPIACLHQFKAGLKIRIYRAVQRMENPPKSLQEWYVKARERQAQFQEEEAFTRVHRPTDPRQKTWVKSNFTASSSRSANHDPDAMQVDVLRQSKPPGSSRQTNGKGKVPSKGPFHALPAPIPTRPVNPDIICHRCGRKGHIKRNCSTKINELKQEELCQIAQWAFERIDEVKSDDDKDSDEDDDDNEDDDSKTEKGFQ